MRRDEGVHECLEVGSPPLRQRVADLPLIVDTLTGELCADGSKALVQARLEALYLVVFGTKVVARAANVSIGFKVRRAAHRRTA